MTPERWKQIERIFHQALERPAAERVSFLKQACAGDEELRREVETLAQSSDEAGSFIEHPALGGVAAVYDRRPSREEKTGAHRAPLQSGTAVSHYRILEKLDAGGMGEVYKAEDSTLHRPVALKFLSVAAVPNLRDDRRPSLIEKSGAHRAPLQPDHAALERFRREARAAAALNHPNICTVYEVGEHAGQPFIAMELLEGKTLRQRLGVGVRRAAPLPLDELLDLAIPIADALDAAHQKGITHRDIKPANIFITSRGQPKILDFGLAKLTQPVAAVYDRQPLMEEQTGAHPAGSGPPLQQTAAPTASLAVEEQRLTMPGMAIGTAAYMSPEQARGENVDARTDLFSLGAVLYEMATGRRAFAGLITPVIFSQILKGDPLPAHSVNPEIPPGLERIITKCLEKSRDLRYQTAAEIRGDLKRLRRDTDSRLLVRPSPPASQFPLSPSANGERAGVRGAGERRSPLRRLLPWALAATVIAALAYGLFTFYRARQPAPVVTGPWVQLTDFTDSAVQPALSPDGRMLAFIRGPSTFFTSGQIYVKLLPDGDPVELTHDSSIKMNPAFSPGGSRIAYLSSNGGNWATWVVPALGGTPQFMLADAFCLTWIDAHRVLYSTEGSGFHLGVVTSDDSGGRKRDIYWPANTFGMAHRSYLSPNHKWVLLAEMDYAGWLPCRVVPFDGSSKGHTVGPPGKGCTSGAWSPDGRWVYLTVLTHGHSHIWRQPFPEGQPEQVTSGPTGEAGVAMAPDGKSFVTSVGTGESSVWVHTAAGDRQVSSQGYAVSPTISPDGKTLFYIAQRGEQSPIYRRGELWRMDLESGQEERVFGDSQISAYYSLSWDGKRILFETRDDKGASHWWVAPLDRRTPPREIPLGPAYGSRFAPDGSIFFGARGGNAYYLYHAKQDGTGRQKVAPAPVINLSAVSPDGRWVIVRKVTTSPSEDQFMAYPVAGGSPVPIREAQGYVSWSPDGRWLYLQWDGKTVALPIPPGRDLPNLPSSGLKSLKQAAEIPGARLYDRAIFPGPNPNIYAYTQVNVHRNLYRIPLQ